MILCKITFLLISRTLSSSAPPPALWTAAAWAWTWRGEAGEGRKSCCWRGWGSTSGQSGWTGKGRKNQKVYLIPTYYRKVFCSRFSRVTVPATYIALNIIYWAVYYDSLPGETLGVECRPEAPSSSWRMPSGEYVFYLSNLEYRHTSETVSFLERISFFWRPSCFIHVER